MRQLRSSLLFAAALGLGAALLPGLQAQAATLRVGIQDDPDGLDPATGGTYAGRFVFAAFCDKLVDIGPDLSIVPQLATAWQWAPDGRSITFTLRSGVRFADGTPFDADAVKFNIERMKTMPDSQRKGELAPISGVEVLSPTQVRFTLASPYVPLLANLSDRAGMMVSPTAVRKEGAGFAAHPVCAGPYRFAERHARDTITVEKDPGYWNAQAAGYDRIVYSYVPDSTVRLQRLRAGDLDVIERVAPTDLKTLRGDAKLQLLSQPGLAVSHLMINVGNGDKAKTPLGQDKTLREALELSIDRNVINRVAFNGEFTPDNQMVPTTSAFHAGIPLPARDVARAKALIAAAGQTRVPLEITFENSPTDARVAQIIQSMAGEAGFDVKLLPLETATAIQRYLAGDFQAYIGNWSGRPDPDPTLYAFFACAGAQNVVKYCDKGLDDALAAARTEADPEKRKAGYASIAAMVTAARPTIPLYHPTWFFGASRAVQGITVYPDGLLRVAGVKPAG